MQWHSDSIILLLQNIIGIRPRERCHRPRWRAPDLHHQHLPIRPETVGPEYPHQSSCKSEFHRNQEMVAIFGDAEAHLWKTKQSANEGENMHSIPVYWDHGVHRKTLLHLSPLQGQYPGEQHAQSLYNNPIMCIMDPKLKKILMPTICSVMDDDKQSMCKFLE